MRRTRGRRGRRSGRDRERRVIDELGQPTPEEFEPRGGDPLERARAAGARVLAVPGLTEAQIDPDALRVVTRLARRGFESYLVGGCVRDLLLGRRPKDFDVATEAHPRQIKRMFQNGRIIGRRFKLVHLVYGDHVVETSTFRAAPREREEGEEGDDLLIVDDNVFGTAEEDARRRDFTINALFFEPLQRLLIDFVGGLEDLRRRVLRTIGDPRVRLAEDPVRILRAVKFSARLDFDIEDATWEAMCDQAQSLERAAPARLVEELTRLLRSGSAAGCFDLLDRCGALAVLMPDLAAFLDADPSDRRAEQLWRLLGHLDQRRTQRGEQEVGLCLAYLLAPLYVHRLAQAEPLQGDTEAMALAGDLLAPLAGVSRLSRHDTGLARRLLANLRRFHLRPSKRFRPLIFVGSAEFSESLALLRDLLLSSGRSLELVEEWELRQQEVGELPPDELQKLKGRRRRRRRS
jgi:poly(A) polymerase